MRLAVTLAALTIATAAQAQPNTPYKPNAGVTAYMDKVHEISMKHLREYSEDVAAALKGSSKAKVLEQVKRNVADSMFDPEAARIKNLKLKPFAEGYIVCGQVNAKNRYGAYTGYKSFVASTSAFQSRDGTGEIEDDLARDMVLFGCNITE